MNEIDIEELYISCENLGLDSIDFNKFTKLRKLDIELCVIDELPDFNKLPYLEELTLTNSLSEDIKKITIENHDNLEYINLEGNYINELKLINIPNLKFLDLDYNPIYFVYLDIPEDTNITIEIYHREEEIAAKLLTESYKGRYFNLLKELVKSNKHICPKCNKHINRYYN